MKKPRLNKDGTIKSRENKSISFNLTEIFEEELLIHAEAQGNFSKYVKRLIYMDKEGFGRDGTVRNTLPIHDFVDVPKEDEDKQKKKMKSLLNALS